MRSILLAATALLLAVPAFAAAPTTGPDGAIVCPTDTGAFWLSNAAHYKPAVMEDMLSTNGCIQLGGGVPVAGIRFFNPHKQGDGSHLMEFLYRGDDGRMYDVWTTSDYIAGLTIVETPPQPAPAPLAPNEYRRHDGTVGVITAPTHVSHATYPPCPGEPRVAADHPCNDPPLDRRNHALDYQPPANDPPFVEWRKTPAPADPPDTN
jgi:hypothetical protein